MKQQRRVLFKPNEVSRIAQNPNFLGSEHTKKLLESKISRLESQKRYG